MNWNVLIVEAIIFAIIFTIIVFYHYGGDKKYSAEAIHNYPSDIQEEYFRTHERLDVSYKSKNVIMAKSFGIVVFTIILVVCAHYAGARTFKNGFIVAFLLMIWIGLYDTLFLDWILFANLKMFRLEGTEHMDEAYHQKWFHLKGMLFPGLLFALIPAILVGFIIQILHQ